MTQELREMLGSPDYHPQHQHQLEGAEAKERKVHGGMVHALNTGHGQLHNVAEGPSLPNDALLQRVDRLDEMICTLEDKAVTGKSWSTPCSSPGTPPATMAAPGGHHSPTLLIPSSLEKRCKPTITVLEEVEEKGTLVERITSLETRVSKLDRSLQAALSKSTEFGHHPTSLATVPSFDPPSKQDDNAIPELNAIEKHEVVPVEQMEAHKDANPRAMHMKDNKHNYEGMQSTSWPTSPYKSPKHSRIKSKSFGKWLSKRFHMSTPSHENTTQGKNMFYERHCWNLHSRSLHSRSRRCWNFKRGSLHPSQDTHSDGD